MKPKSTLRSFLVLAGSSLLAISSASATTLTWDNGAATGKWNTADLNWTGSAWNNATPDDAILGATGVGAITLTEPVTAGSITISTAGYTINPSTHGLTLNTGITANEGATIQGGSITLGASNAWSVAASKTLTVNSAISGVGFGITKSGTGKLTLTNDLSTFSGGIVLNAGDLEAQTNARLGDPSNTITVGGDSTFTGGSVTYARSIALNNDAILTNGNNNNPTFSGNLTGTGGLRVSNGFGSQVTLNGTANTFEGPLLIAGTGGSGQAYRFAVNSLADSVTANGSIVFSSTPVTHPNGSVFEYTGSTNLVLANRVIEIASTGATPTNGHQIRSSGIGTLTVNTNLSVTSTAAQTLRLNGASLVNNTFAGTITDGASTALSLSKTDAGVWNVTNAANSYIGGTTVSGGTLGFASGALGTTGTINATGGTLRWLPGNTQDISSRLTMAAGTTTFDTNGNNVTFATAIGSSSAGALVKTGSGTLTLNGISTYSGATTVNVGTLSLDYTTVDSKLADGAALILGGGTVDLKNGAGSHTEIVSATTLTALTGSYVTQSSGSSVLQMGTITPNTGTVNFGAPSIATTNNTHTAGTILGTWATVGGDWAISADSGTNIPITAYTGYVDYTRLDGGTQIIVDDSTKNIRVIDGTGIAADITLAATTTNTNTINQSATGGAVTIDAASKTLLTNGILMGSTAGALTIGTSVGSGTLKSAAATGPVIVTNNSTSNLLTINSVIANNTTTSLVKNGPGVLVLSAINTYTGGTVLQDGTIRAGATSGSSSTNGILGGAFNNGITIANKSTAVFDLDGYTVYVKDVLGGGSLGGNLTLGSGTLFITNPSNSANPYGGIISGMGNLMVNGSSGWTTTGAHTYTGTTTLGTGNVGFTVSILADGGQASGLGASTNAAANLVFTGTGTQAPRVRYNSTTIAETDRRFTLSGNGGFEVVGAGSVNWTNTAAITHGVTTAKTLYFLGAGTGTGTMAAQITDSTGATSISKGLANNATGNTWNLSNTNNTFNGDIILSTTTNAAGTLAYASAGGSNAIKFNQTTSTATLSYIGSGQTMTGAITASALTTGTITLDASGTGAVNYSDTGSLGSAASGNKNLILSGTNTGDNTLAGQWVDNTGGAATLTKNGAGKWILTGTHNYTGATTVNGGTLLVNSPGSLAVGSAVTVNAGTLGGTGSISGAVTIGNSTGIADSILAPGASIGNLATGNLTFNSDGGYVVEVNATSVTSDRTNVTGAVAINASTPLSVKLTGTLAASQQYVIVSNDGVDAITGTFAGLAQDAVVGTFGGTDLKISYTGGDGNDIVLYTDGGGTTFADWRTANGAGSQTLADDHDNDGVDNGTEFFLGGATNTTGFTPLPGVANNTGILSVTWTKHPNYPGVYNTDYVVETSATLTGPWTPETSPGNVTITGNDVKYTFPGGPAYSGKNFARLKVTGP